MSNLRPRQPTRKTRRGRGEDSVYPLPDGRWEAAADLGMHPGTGERRRIKRQRATKAEAMAALQEAKEKASGFVSVDENVTVKEHFNRWFEEVARLSLRPSTLTSYRGAADRHVLPFIGALKLKDLTPSVLQTFLAERAKAKAATRQLQLGVTALREALDNARRLGLVERNVAADGDAPKHKKKRKASPDEAKEGDDVFCYSVDQAKLLLSKCEAHEKKHVRAQLPCLELAFDSGARQGELFGAQWPDFDLNDLDHASWSIQHNLIAVSSTKEAELAAEAGKGTLVAPDLLLTTTPKTDDGYRTIPLSRRCAEILKAHRDAAGGDDAVGFVFKGSRGAPLRHKRFWDTVLWPLEQAAKLPRLTFHGIRHTTATALLEAGVPVHVVSHRLGHKDVATTLRIYAHVLKAMARKGAQTAADLFGGRATTRANGANDGEQRRTVADHENPGKPQ